MTSKKSIIGPLQRAVYARLTGDTGAGGLVPVVSPLVTGVYDSTPPEATLPYIVLGEFAGVPKRFVGGGPSLVMASFDLTAHDDDTAIDTLALISERIATLLDDYPVAIDDHSTVYVHLERERKDPAPEINVQRFVFEFSVAATRT